MQSRPTEVSKQQPSDASHSEISPSSQYGVIEDRDAASDLPPLEAGSETESAAPLPPGAPTRAGDTNPESSSNGLNLPLTPRNRSPVDRIIEHENTPVSYSRGRSQGPDFQVIPRPKGSAPSRVKLTDFPNGGLIVDQGKREQQTDIKQKS